MELKKKNLLIVQIKLHHAGLSQGLKALEGNMARIAKYILTQPVKSFNTNGLFEENNQYHSLLLDDKSKKSIETRILRNLNLIFHHQKKL